jgi:CspA family cold shock protein
MSRSKTISKQWMLGTVHWFDELSGEGLIKSDDGQNYYVHYSAIESDDRRKSLQDKQKVKFQAAIDPSLAQVSRVKEV